VVRQAETAAIKSQGPTKSALFGRRLSALYTRATLEAGEDLGGGPQDDAVGKGRLSSYLMCIAGDARLSGPTQEDRRLVILVMQASHVSWPSNTWCKRWQVGACHENLKIKVEPGRKL
jgi:hypothetical protein